MCIKLLNMESKLLTLDTPGLGLKGVGIRGNLRKL